MQPGDVVMRKTDEQKVASYQERMAKLRAKVKRIEHRKSQQERRDHIHVGVIVGWGMMDMASEHPKAEVRSVLMVVIKNYLVEHPNDRAMMDLLARVSGAPVVEPAIALVQEEAAE